MEDEVYPLMKFLVETVPFHELYWTGICKQAGLDALTPQSPPHADDYNFQVYDIADALFINSRNALLVFLANFQICPRQVNFARSAPGSSSTL